MSRRAIVLLAAALTVVAAFSAFAVAASKRGHIVTGGKSTDVTVRVRPAANGGAVLAADPSSKAKAGKERYRLVITSSERRYLQDALRRIERANRPKPGGTPGLPTTPVPPPPVITPPPPPPTGTAGFEVGVGMRNWDDNDRAAQQTLHARVCRTEVNIADLAGLAQRSGFYRSLGCRPQPLLGFEAAPSNSTIDAAVTWLRGNAAAYGITHVEFGNENYIRQSTQGGQYARQANYMIGRLAGSGVGLLVQADDNNATSPYWVNAMFDAVPNLHPAGWVIHPYGGNGDHLRRVNRVWGYLQARNADPAIKFYATEYGIATDNGRSSLQPNNYAWPPNINYTDAGAALRRTVTDFQASGKVAQVILYQSTDQQPSGASSQREHYFGLLQADGVAHKGAVTDAAVDLLAG